MDKPLISRRLMDSDGSLAETPSGTPKVGILGSGDFARSLATRLVGSGFSVVVGSHNPKRIAGLFPSSVHVTFQEQAVSSPEIIFVAVFREHYSSLCALSDQLAGKILVDVSNPTENEHLPHRESNDEFLASLFPACTVVEAFNVISAWTRQAGPRDGNQQVGSGEIAITAININDSCLQEPSAHQLCLCIVSANLTSLLNSILYGRKLRLRVVSDRPQKPKVAELGFEPCSEESETHVSSAVVTGFPRSEQRWNR